MTAFSLVLRSAGKVGTVREGEGRHRMKTMLCTRLLVLTLDWSVGGDWLGEGVVDDRLPPPSHDPVTLDNPTVSLDGVGHNVVQ